MSDVVAALEAELADARAEVARWRQERDEHARAMINPRLKLDAIDRDIRRAALEEAAMACEEYARGPVDEWPSGTAAAVARKLRDAIRALLPAPEAKAAFKVGDRVRYTGGPPYRGEIGVVLYLRDDRGTAVVRLGNGVEIQGAESLFEPAPLTGPELAERHGFKPHGRSAAQAMGAPDPGAYAKPEKEPEGELVRVERHGHWHVLVGDVGAEVCEDEWQARTLCDRLRAAISAHVARAVEADRQRREAKLPADVEREVRVEEQHGAWTVRLWGVLVWQDDDGARARSIAHGISMALRYASPSRPSRMREAKEWLQRRDCMVHVSEGGEWVIERLGDEIGRARTLVRAVAKARKAWGER